MIAATEGAAAVPFLDLRASQRELDTELDELWLRVTREGGYVGGELVTSFERTWAAACGTQHAVGVANGTDAIELVLRALGVGAGDEVVVPANTFIATAGAVVAAGARPVFADVDDETLLMTPETLRAAMTTRTAAVVVVHLFGNPLDVEAVSQVAARAGVHLVEDCAQAQGASWRGRPVGSFGAAGCFSFYPGKNLGAFGDAGAVVTDDARLAERVRVLGDHGRSPSSRQVHEVVGRNSRLDALQAGVLSAKARHLLAWNEARRWASRLYSSLLSQDGRVRTTPVLAGGLSSHHLEVVRVPSRDVVAARLQADGISTGIHYATPCHLNPGYASYRTGALPVVERAAGSLLSLPLFPGITEAQVGRVCAALLAAVAEEVEG